MSSSSSATADAQAARALVQTVLINWLCDRYHDLASLASESLKQRIHFLSVPDRSNLKELCTWDPPSTASSSSSSTACPAWSPAQIDAFIHDSWSPDQLPLHPPKIRLSGTAETTRSPPPFSLPLSSLSFDSWETTPVLVKQLDPETIHAKIPIGQAGKSILVMILSSELESDRSENSQQQQQHSTGKVPRWKYHNMVAVSESDLMGAQSSGWKLLSEHQAQGDEQVEEEEGEGVKAEARALPHSLGNLVDGTSLPPLLPAGQDNVGRVQDEDAGEGEGEDEDDSDDDYWGQYGDTEDESTADENNEGADASKAKEQQGNPFSEAVAETPNDEDDDDEEEYWRKYAEQQEQQEAEERKKKLKSQRGGVSVGFDDGNADDSMGSRRVLAEIEDPATTTTTSMIGQVDPNMLSSLLQMLSTQGLQQDLPALDKDRSQEGVKPAAVDVDPLNEHSQSSSSSSTAPPSNPISTLERSLRAAVSQAKLDGLSKEQVFEVLSGIYTSSPFQ